MRKVLLLALLSVPVLAQDSLPTPPDGWWNGLGEGGKYPSASFQLEQEGAPVTLNFVITEIKGDSIIFTTESVIPGLELPKQVQRIHAPSSELTQGAAGLPEGAMVKKLGTETLTVDGQKWDCTIYEVSFGGQTMKVWHSSELLPLFSGGNVKLETESGGMVVKMIMTKYSGRRLSAGS